MIFSLMNWGRPVDHIIGYWHHNIVCLSVCLSVCPFVRPSVCDAMHLSTLISIISARQHAIARYMPSPVRLSVRPSVRHTGGSVKDG